MTLRRADLEKELCSKINAEGKSFEARYHDECAELRERILYVLQRIEDEIDDAAVDQLEEVQDYVHDVAISFGVLL